jgi:hypothetical protein
MRMTQQRFLIVLVYRLKQEKYLNEATRYEYFKVNVDSSEENWIFNDN